MAFTPSSVPLCIRILIDVILYLAASGGVVIIFTLVEPVRRGFYCDDVTIRYPRSSDTVTNLHLLLIGTLSPIVAIVSLELLNRLILGRRRGAKDYFLATGKLVGMYLYGLLICVLVTEIIKISVGRLRPHFLETCKPDFSTINCSQGYITDFHCTGNGSERRLRDARKSFPSGHASLAFYDAIYIVIYLEERFEVTFSTLLKSLLQVALVLVATFCAVSRVSDHRHHPEDVIAGAFVGTGVAIFLVFWVGRHMRRESALPRVNRAAAWRGGESVVLTDALETPEPKCPRTPPHSANHLTELKNPPLLRSPPHE